MCEVNDCCFPKNVEGVDLVDVGLGGVEDGVPEEAGCFVRGSDADLVPVLFFFGFFHDRLVFFQFVVFAVVLGFVALFVVVLFADGFEVCVE